MDHTLKTKGKHMTQKQIMFRICWIRDGGKPSTVKIKGNNNKLVIFYGISLFLGINTHKN